MACFAITYSVTFIVILLYRLWCVGAVFNSKRTLTRVEETLLQEYRMQVARKLTTIESSRDFLRIFVANNEIEPTFVSMVNKTVQKKKKGRFFAQGVAIHFNEEISNQAMEAWIRHGDSVGCSEPQPQMLDMFEELGISRGIGTYIYPSCTWVRRCGGSGCCTSDLQECASVPGTRTNVTKPFVMIAENGFDEGLQVTTESQFLNYTLYEDTACACKNRPEGELPCSHVTCPSNQGFSVATCGCKCLKDCPGPYIQDPDTCQCDCRPGDKQCLKVMRGKRALPAADCLCVGHGCEKPKCRRHWGFSTASCRCEERAPPTVWARMYKINNEVPLPVETQTNEEPTNEYASGMTPPLTSAETTTIVTPLILEEGDDNDEEEEDDEGTTERGSSSSSSTDEILTEDPDPYDPLVRVPVAPEQRYAGGRQYQHQVQHETRTIGSRAYNHTSASRGSIVFEESSRRGSRIGQDLEDTTSVNDRTETATSGTTTTTRQDSYTHRRGRFLGRVGLEDDEDEVVTELGEVGSGSVPMDDDD
nr:uncharacterized protein LOC129261422 [Lytechinus pictus]